MLSIVDLSISVQMITKLFENQPRRYQSFALPNSFKDYTFERKTFRI